MPDFRRHILPSSETELKALFPAKNLERIIHIQAVCISGRASKCPTEDKHNIFVHSLGRKTGSSSSGCTKTCNGSCCIYSTMGQGTEDQAKGRKPLQVEKLEGIKITYRRKGCSLVGGRNGRRSEVWAPCHRLLDPRRVFPDLISPPTLCLCGSRELRGRVVSSTGVTVLYLGHFS